MTRGRVHMAVGAAVVAGLALWPWITHVPQYSLTRWEYIFAGLMVAIGLNIVTGFAGQLSLGPGAVYAIAGYAAALLADHYASSVGIVGMCAIAVAVAAVIGLVIGVPSLRVGGFYLAMTTLFFALLVPVVASNWTFVGKERGISLIANIDFTQRWAGIGLYEMSLAVVVALLLGSWWLLESRAGRQFVTLTTRYGT
jgi:ABC-type branched-subunit amino acid transport system permease subunit